MKKTLILCVNYNSYKELYDYLNSINDAAKLTVENLEVEVFVADNTTINIQKISTSNYNSIKIRLFLFYENKGYLGAAFDMLNSVSNKIEYDYFIISNVDLKLTESFFVELLKEKVENTAWLAPQVQTISTGKDENPYMLFRPRKLKLNLLRLMYYFPVLYSLYLLIRKYRNKKEYKYSQRTEKIDIYAGHGSIMIFTKQFISENSPFCFPTFMYGEEIYLAELARLSDMNIVYIPNIKVINIGNVSTKLLGNKKKCQMSYNALTVIDKLYFK